MTVLSVVMADDAIDPVLPTDSLVDAAPASATGPSDPRQWVDLHGNYLFRYALIRVRNETVAEDRSIHTTTSSKNRWPLSPPARLGWGNSIAFLSGNHDSRESGKIDTRGPGQIGERWLDAFGVELNCSLIVKTGCGILQ